MDGIGKSGAKADPSAPLRVSRTKGAPKKQVNRDVAPKPQPRGDVQAAINNLFAEAGLKSKKAPGPSKPRPEHERTVKRSKSTPNIPRKNLANVVVGALNDLHDQKKRTEKKQTAPDERKLRRTKTQAQLPKRTAETQDKAEASERKLRVPKLFRKKNFFFSTKHPDRKPTHYFAEIDRDKPGFSKSGRLRQQHSSGPLAHEDRRPSIHLFYGAGSVDNANKMEKEINSYKKSGEKLTPSVRGRMADHVREPRQGDIHMELQQKGNRVRAFHRSGGTVDVSKPTPNDREIKKIFRDIKEPKP